MPTAFSGVHVRAGLYLVVTRRWRGSTGTATGAPRYTSPRPSTRYSASKTIVAHRVDVVEAVDAPDELDVPRAPRARRRARRACRSSIASRVAGSSHDSGRCTMRLSTTTSSSAGSSSSAAGEQLDDGVGRVLDRVELHLQRADPGGDLERGERRLGRPATRRARARGGAGRSRGSWARTRRARRRRPGPR